MKLFLKKNILFIVCCLSLGVVQLHAQTYRPSPAQRVEANQRGIVNNDQINRARTLDQVACDNARQALTHSKNLHQPCRDAEALQQQSDEAASDAWALFDVQFNAPNAACRDYISNQERALRTRRDALDAQSSQKDDECQANGGNLRLKMAIEDAKESACRACRGNVPELGQYACPFGDPAVSPR